MNTPSSTHSIMRATTYLLGGERLNKLAYAFNPDILISTHDDHSRSRNIVEYNVTGLLAHEVAAMEDKIQQLIASFELTGSFCYIEKFERTVA